MRYSNKTMEELEDIEVELLEMEYNGEHHAVNYNLIQLYESMYKSVRKRAQHTRDHEDLGAVDYVKHKLVNRLIKYGTYLKIGTEKSDYDAKKTLKKVLTFDAKNPIVHYRLGFIAYKENVFHDACLYFKQAIEFQELEQSHNWQLNDLQLHRAHLYLVNSSLFVAHEANEKLKKLPLLEETTMKQYEISPLYNVINENDTYLKSHAFVKFMNEGEEHCSKEECDNLYELDSIDNRLILYFSDRECGLRYNMKREIVNPSDAYLLKDMLRSKKSSLLVDDLLEHFTKDIVSKNTFIKRISRLRKLLKQFGVPEVIENDRSSEQTAYFYNGAVPFVMMERVEDALD
ncbi:hypothetical protein [Desertibacillus haloalkaliphilus]|uniref:hypothetical protein n=1 Tax=Desertibacillus haloalkaliphilus TaxID=1328930 RepID=UPI001C273D90|nr:hypothetical protein [Desertibacillus haloalkaliphilus]